MPSLLSTREGCRGSAQGDAGVRRPSAGAGSDEEQRGGVFCFLLFGCFLAGILHFFKLKIWLIRFFVVYLLLQNVAACLRRACKG